MTNSTIAFENEVYVIPKAQFEEKDQYVCACGLSAKLPFCDGAHFRCGTTHKPVKVKIEGDNVLGSYCIDIDEYIFFCSNNKRF